MIPRCRDCAHLRKSCAGFEFARCDVSQEDNGEPKFANLSRRYGPCKREGKLFKPRIPWWMPLWRWLS